MQIYNILPASDGSWKAVLEGEGELMVGTTDQRKLIGIMAKWAQKTGETITLRIHSAQGELVEEQIIEG